MKRKQSKTHNCWNELSKHNSNFRCVFSENTKTITERILHFNDNLNIANLEITILWYQTINIVPYKLLFFFQFLLHNLKLYGIHCSECSKRTSNSIWALPTGACIFVPISEKGWGWWGLISRVNSLLLHCNAHKDHYWSENVQTYTFLESLVDVSIFWWFCRMIWTAK